MRKINTTCSSKIVTWDSKTKTLTTQGRIRKIEAAGEPEERKIKVGDRVRVIRRAIYANSGRPPAERESVKTVLAMPYDNVVKLSGVKGSLRWEGQTFESKALKYELIEVL